MCVHACAFAHVYVSVGGLGFQLVRVAMLSFSSHPCHFVLSYHSPLSHYRRPLSVTRPFPETLRTLSGFFRNASAKFPAKSPANQGEANSIGQPERELRINAVGDAPGGDYMLGGRRPMLGGVGLTRRGRREGEEE